MKILADKTESKCLEKDQKLKLMEKDFEDRLINSQSNVKATKSKPVNHLTSFKWTSPQTNTQDIMAVDPKNVANDGDKLPDFLTLPFGKPPDIQKFLVTKDLIGHSI